MEKYLEKYNEWLESDAFDEKTKAELLSIKDNDEEIKERFYKDLEFGTGGLRGIIGAGTNRLNIYTVRKATQGLSNYIKENKIENPSAVIAYDSRRMSPEFALESARVFASNGIKAYVFKSLRPTPELSFAIRRLGAAAGIVITASHNPPEYNGYKVYWSDGAQVSAPMDKEIISRVNSIEGFSFHAMDEKDAVEKGLLEYIGEEIDDEYIKNVLAQSRRKTDNAALKVVYTPLNGTGNVPVNRALKEAGFTNVYNVEPQRYPDSEFTTIGYPNPEDKAVFKLGIELARKVNADLVIATDPDADRIGVAVKEKDGSFSFLTGNMTASILCEYICSAEKEKGSLPENGVVIRTVVSTPMTEKIAEAFGLESVDVLTGFKYIGGKIKEYEKTKEHTFVFGFEESYGCLSGTYARDKDAVSAALLVCEAAAYNKKLGLTLTERLEKICEKYGFFKEETVSVTMKGITGAEKIKGIMEKLRSKTPEKIGGKRVCLECDFKKEVFTDLVTGETLKRSTSSSDIIRYVLEDESWVCVRPSGTEPKIKIYAGVKGESEADAKDKLERLKEAAMELL